MNFDNLVEDAEKHGAEYEPEILEVGLPDCFRLTSDELKSLITQYIIADRAQGQEPVAKFARHGASITSFEYLSGADHLPIGEHLLFAHAQPTAEIQAQTLEKAADKFNDEFMEYGFIRDAETRNALVIMAARLREGEPIEVEIAETIRSSDAVCDSYAEENQRLTAQNAKLMEALKHCHEVFVKYEINRIDGDEISDKAISIIMEALTPQPEKERKE